MTTSSTWTRRSTSVSSPASTQNIFFTIENFNYRCIKYSNLFRVFSIFFSVHFKTSFSVWFKIVNHFYNLNHTRIEKLQDKRISEEWLEKNPSIKMKTFPSQASRSFIMHMISDEKNIFIVGDERRDLEKIQVLGS